MNIRPATPQDAAEIANVHINSWREAYQGLLPQDFLDDRPLQFKDRYQLWQRVTADHTQTTFVAKHEEYGVVGFINGNKARDKKFEGDAEVWSLYLLKKFHRQKIGFRLLKAYFDKCQMMGFDKAYLWVLKDNPTIQFYERTGARFTGDVQTDKIGGKSVEELCYRWENILLNTSF